ncbi:unconventional myosin-IXb isoform X2 [Denticeps clupeoides]|uniref:unconventional myosin-IXb isoform X2 n=1 Tax=Denticeps clupeoides TaxID=299321 RepID=UPI0010A4D6E1|nr:unconventional myosin-IXb-like isoform X2 [Denticeps clupeoides]
MSVTNGEGSAGQGEERCFLQVYARSSQETLRRCAVAVTESTGADAVVRDAAASLGLDPSKRHVLVEVREGEGDAWPLPPADRPARRFLRWPRSAQARHPPSEGYYFMLEEVGEDDPAGLDNRGFLPPEQDDYSDLCRLPVLTEGKILDALRRRFLSKKIYTYASNILIAINPFRFLPIYNPKFVAMYENHRLGKLPPHIFAIADTAFHAMLRKRVDQVVVISGESGSGKTHSTNFLIHCLTALSQKGYTSGVERTILGAGPVLEAFGNAKTAHNNNSSRFGKFIQVNYTESGAVRGAIIEKYLLEKCRLISREKCERNYHVFYYLLVGASEEERKEFKLLEPDDYVYLNQESLNLEDDELEIKHEFKRLQQAMEMVGFLPATKKQIFSVLSAILHLGNVTYQQAENGEGLDVGPPDVLDTLSSLLKVKMELLVQALTKRKATTANDTLILPYSLSEAITARDSMAKSLYSSLFDWIVLRINHALLNRNNMETSVPNLSIGVLDIFGFEDFRTNSFEQFCINYANEQLQYYCNQYIFTLEQAEYQAEGITWRNVDYTDNLGCIHLISKKPTGLFHLLDEESNFPHATEATLLDKFKQQHQKSPYFVPTPVMEPAFVIQHYAGKVKYQIKDFRERNMDHIRPDIVAVLRSSERGYLRQLVAAHPVAIFRWGILRATIRTLAAFNQAGRRRAEKYPGEVRRYSRSSFDKRRQSYILERVMSQSMIDFSFDSSEELPLDVFEDIFTTFENKKDLHAQTSTSVKMLGGGGPHKLQRSGVFLRKCYRPFQKSRTSRNKQLIPKNLVDSSSLKFIVGLTLHNHPSRCLLQLHKKKKPPSISAQFQSSLNQLMETLKKAEPFFVRCIRSNAEKRDMHFDEALVLKQLRYTGMLETVRIRRSGYGAKFTFTEFINQFQVLLPVTITTPQKDIVNLLQELGLDKNNYQIGKTKVFLKEGETHKLQEALHKKVILSIIALQHWFRACLARKQFLYKRRAAVTIQRCWRRFHDRRRWKAASLIQIIWRESHHRVEYMQRRDNFKRMQLLAERRRRMEEAMRNVSSEKTKKPLPLLPLQQREQEDNQSTSTKSTEPSSKVRDEAQDQSKVSNRTEPKVTEEDDRKPDEPTDPLSQNENGKSKRASADSSSLQRYNKSMREKAEKWKERRSEVLQYMGESSSAESRCLKNLKGQSMSLDNLYGLSSSESDSGATSPEGTMRVHRVQKHRRRLAPARSGLMLKGEDGQEEYWSFPLPPISPTGSVRVNPKPLPKIKMPVEADGTKQPQMRTSVVSPTTPIERPGFLNMFRRKRPHTPEDGAVPRVTSPSHTPLSNQPLSQVKRTLKISRATRVQKSWNSSLDREITDTNELRHLDEFLGNQINDLRNRNKDLSSTELIFLTATNDFREHVKNMYSSPKPSVAYKGLMTLYQKKVETLAEPNQKAEINLVVNLFQSILDGFIRGEIKKLLSEPVQPNKKSKEKQKKVKGLHSPLGHMFNTYQVTIMQNCELCGNFIWGMEKACMCNSCKMVCHHKCIPKIITDCSTRTTKKNKNEPGTLHFGVDIGALTTISSPVPMVIEMLLVHVEMHGLYTEGIYRKSGSAGQARELHQILETDPKTACLENYPIHTITGLVKRWLRELPDPLMTYNLYNDFLHAVDLPQASEQIQAIYHKLEELPTAYLDTLERLIFHLVRVAREENYNRMSANSLAIVFAPCILRCPDASDPLLSMKDVSRTTVCVELLINEQFRKYNEKMQEIQQLELAEAFAVKQLKLLRQNTINEGPQTDMRSLSIPTENTLIERIKSIKQEKVDLTFRLGEFEQETSDCIIDTGFLLSTASPLEGQSKALNSEGKKPDELNRQKVGCPPAPPSAALKPKLDDQSRRPQHRDGTQSLCIIPEKDGLVPAQASRAQEASAKSSRHYSDLSIPYIDE